MKIKNIIVKGLTILLAAVAIATVAPTAVKADYYDCFAGKHTYKFDYNRVPATCTTPGANIYFCVTCLKGIERWDTPALGHKKDKGRVVVMPTATTDGYALYRCEHCGMYMGEEVLKATSAPLPTVVQTPAPTVLDPRVQSPLAAKPMYFDTNMLAVCYIPYHSLVSLNGVCVNIDAIGAQPLAPAMQVPGKYVIQVTPNTNTAHSEANKKTFVVNIPSKAGKPITVTEQ